MAGFCTFLGGQSRMERGLKSSDQIIRVFICVHEFPATKLINSVRYRLVFPKKGDKNFKHFFEIFKKF